MKDYALENRFSYYDAEDSLMNELVQTNFMHFALYMDQLIPDGRNKKLMFEKLEEAWDRADRALDPRGA